MSYKMAQAIHLTAVLLCLLLMSEAQPCLQGLPPYYNDNGPALRKNTQAIVPAYRFSCSGNVTHWGACVRQSRQADITCIQFQVWRPSGTQCYTLEGENTVEGQLVDGCLELTAVTPEQQVQVQPGDVVGFYSSSSRVQLVRDTNVTVFNINSTCSISSTCSDRCGMDLERTAARAPVITASVKPAPSMPMLITSQSSVLDSTSLQPTSAHTTLSNHPQISRVHTTSSLSVIQGAAVLTNLPLNSPTFSQSDSIIPQVATKLTTPPISSQYFSHPVTAPASLPLNYIILLTITGIIVLFAAVFVIAGVYVWRRRKTGITQVVTPNTAYSIDLIPTNENAAYGTVINFRESITMNPNEAYSGILTEENEYAVISD